MGPTTLDSSERARIGDAIGAAEAGTSGEIYIVVAGTSDDFQWIPILWAAIIALIVPWPLHFLTHWSAGTILVMQTLTFVLTAGVASYPALRYRLVPPSIAGEAARRAAQSLFLAHGLHLTESRTGLLIYVALVDRRVEIVTDAGINSKVDQSVWDELAREIAGAARRGDLAEGLIAAVRRTGTLLAQHCPRAHDDRNELPDRVVVI
jgi:putative membrane protein